MIENELDNRFPDNIDLSDLLDLGKIGVLKQLRMFLVTQNFLYLCPKEGRFVRNYMNKQQFR
ncbi:MAG TPA: hypothetical protein ENG12_01455 [Candidatus Altiarchaeales archaeon]|nr:hypothetical protein [Candidatus Altiarchaeales archaeon]